MQLRTGLAFLLVTMSFLPISGVLAQQGYEPVRFTVSKFTINGDNPIGDKADKVLAPYIGEQSGLEGLSAAADALEQAIIKEGFSFYRVSLQPQELTSGTVQFQVIKFAIGSINVSGNEFFDQENIEHSLPLLKSGETPNTKTLSRSLKLANNHASKNILLKFKEGESGDTIDADITVKDQNPQIFFVTLDNTGSEDTKEVRTTLGYQHGNLFNKDHSLTATLTVAPEDPDATTQIGFNYHLPMYRHGANLDFLFSDSEINSGTVGSGIAINGKGQVLGFTYTRPLLTDTNFNHQWTAGFQNKSFDNEITVGTTPISSKVISSPLILGYSFNYATQSGAINGGISADGNMGVGGDNTDAAYAAVRTGAEKSWSTVKYNLSYDHVFAKNWLIHGGFMGQSSSDNLISGEQFGVGGSASLRGFEERSVTGDIGNYLTLEVWTPAYFGARYLFFIDNASVETNDTPGASDATSFDLASYGIGARWSWKQQLSVSLDVGVISKGLSPTEGANTGSTDPINLDDDTKAHFNLIYRF